MQEESWDIHPCLCRREVGRNIAAFGDCSPSDMVPCSACISGDKSQVDVSIFGNTYRTYLNGDIEESKPKMKDENHSWRSGSQMKYQRNEVSFTRHKNTKIKRMLWKVIPKADITPIQEECCELGADMANFNETVISADHFSDLTDITPIKEEQCELGCAGANYNETVSTMDHSSDQIDITSIKEERCELGADEAKYNERVNTVSDYSDKKEICCDEKDQLKCDSETAIKQSSDRLTEAKTKTSPWKRVRVMMKNQQQASRKGGLNVTRRCPSIN